MSKNAKQQTPHTPATPAQTTSIEFGSDDALALTRTQIKSFLAHTNNQPVINELESVLKSGRNQVGWKHLGRLLLEEIKEHAFAE